MVYTFTDNQDRVLLTVSKNGSEALETYNVYDDRGLLRYVLSPKASARIGTSIDATVLDNYAYRYEYDPRGRMILKKLPGCEPIYMVYDGKDRMVMSQDGKQRAESADKWSYSLYDRKNRVVEMGEVVLTSSTDHSALQTAASATTDYTPSGTLTPLQYTQYDNYTNIPQAYGFTPVAGYVQNNHNLITGLITRVKTRVLGTDTWLATVTYYDNKCRVIQTVSDNVQGGTSRLDMAYDFVGNLIKQRECHTHSSRTDIVETVNDYDDRGRLLSCSTTLNGGAAATTTYGYDAVGRLVSKTMGNTTETMDYNVRGWLTSKSSDPFTMNLRYQDALADDAKCWNGNIGEWEWQHGTNDELMYRFDYDDVNRLTSAASFQKTGGSWGSATNSNKFEEKGISYDRNGNILSLVRTAGGTTVDDLVYGYTGNRLTALDEAVRTAPSNDVYAPGSAAIGTYTYDTNGNMISDSRKGLIFNYNFLNLLDEVKSGETVKAKYTWLADGSKLRVRDDGGNGFEYLGSLTYTSGSSGLQLEAANFAGGTIRVSGASQEINYFLTDHLGSVRAIVDASGNVKERNDYYAFGAKHVRGDYPQNTNRYDYNGKEEQITGDLGFLDYGARMYDAALGRWFNMDPASEKFYTNSPYAYCGNSPVMLVDPDGRDCRVYFECDSYGNLIGIRIETTIWITGPNASDSLADELNNFAKRFFQSMDVGGIKITFDIQYKYYDKDLEFTSLLNRGKLFRPGDNTLEFVNKVSTLDDRSHVLGGNRGQIYSDVAKNFNAITHETGHFLGLSDRYDEYVGNNIIPPHHIEGHKGFENDFMGKRAANSNANLSINRFHYERYKSLGNTQNIMINSLLINGFIDQNHNGHRLTPYENGGIHKKDHNGTLRNGKEYWKDDPIFK